MEVFRGLLNERVRLVCVAYVSNVLGTVNPVKEMIDAAHALGAYALVDGARYPAIRIDVRALDCDFFAFRGIRCTGPRELVSCMESVACWNRCHLGRAGEK